MNLLVYQKPMMYIGFELGISSQLPPKIWPQKGLRFLSFGQKSPKISIKNKIKFI
jgi:hypothetical protein